MVLYASHGLDAAAILNARSLSYSEIACVAVLSWDVFVTLADEVRSVMTRFDCLPVLMDSQVELIWK